MWGKTEDGIETKPKKRLQMGGAANARALQQWNNDENTHRLAWVTSCGV